MTETISITQGELDRLLTGHSLEPAKYAEYARADMLPEHRTLLTRNLSEKAAFVSNVSISQRELDALFV